MSTSTIETLVGVWGTHNPGGGTDETLVLFPDGAGALDYYNMGGYCGRETFRWAAEDTHLRFEGYINIFRVETAEFEIEDYVRPDEVRTKMLSVFPKGREAGPERFIKFGLVESYEIPKEARER